MLERKVLLCCNLVTCVATWRAILVRCAKLCCSMPELEQSIGASVGSEGKDESYRHTPLDSEMIDVRMQCHPNGMRAIGQTLECGARRAERLLRAEA